MPKHFPQKSPRSPAFPEPVSATRNESKNWLPSVGSIMSCLLFLSVSVVVVGDLVSIFKMNLLVVSLFAKPWSFSQQETHTCHMSVT